MGRTALKDGLCTNSLRSLDTPQGLVVPPVKYAATFFEDVLRCNIIQKTFSQRPIIVSRKEE